MGDVLAHRSAGVPLPAAGPPKAVEAVPRHVRDATVLRLRREGLSLAQIGRSLSLALVKGTVSRIVARLEDGEVYQEAVTPPPAEEW